MRLAVLGTGYVGLVAGAGFSDFGNDVTCVDIDGAKVERLRAGELPIYEPGLEALVRRNVAEKRLRFTTDLAEAVRGAQVVFIAVGTPSAHDGSADLTQVLEAARAVGRAMTGFTVVVTKSTVPVGTAARIEQAMREVTTERFAVASNPEFLKEGDAVHDFMKPDRIILGTDDAEARTLLRNLYAPFVRTNDRVLMMDARSAELTKYASNAYLATRISFMNDVANLCERVGADVEMVRRGMGMDARIGPKFLFPGIGYGGSCFPKDVKAAIATAREVGGTLEILEAVHRVNERQKARLADKMVAHFGALAGKRIALWGLAFKPGTDDVREAPSGVVIERLLEAGAEVHAHDPVANEPVRRRFGDRVRTFDDHYQAADGAHGLALLTEWHQFRRPDFQRLKGLLAEPVLFDGRNIWEPDEVRPLGFTYYGIGRGSMVHERTQRARHDLDWLPPSFKAIRWTVAGTLWAGMAAGFVAMVAKSEIIFFGKGIAVLAAGGYYAGDRAAKAVLRGRLQRLARGAVDLRGLARETDGELVHVRGQVKAQETIGGLLDGAARAVYRRVVFTLGTDRWVHEAGCDFQIVDESGERAIVEVEGARLISPDPKRARVAPEGASFLRNLAMGLPPDAMAELPAYQKRRHRLVVTAGERLLRDGDTVEVVGYKSRRVDPTIAERLARETPMRATLRAGKSLPLLLAPAG